MSLGGQFFAIYLQLLSLSVKTSTFDLHVFLHVSLSRNQLLASSGILAGRSNQPRTKVKAWLDEETWFDVHEAIAAGLADKRYTEASSHAALAATIFARYSIPPRYERSLRAPVVAALDHLRMTARIARNANYYSSYKSFSSQAAFEVKAILKMPATSTEDLMIVNELLESITSAKYWPRD